MRPFARTTLRWSAAALLCASCLASGNAPPKVLRLALQHAETGFDPAMVAEVYSAVVIAAIMEPPLTYDYLARPAKLVPLTAEALPEVSADGRTYTLRIRPGIAFADDPAFGGRRRELTADDYAYAIKRLVDPALRSPNAYLVADKIVGLSEAAAAAANGRARFDYGAPVRGLDVADRHTLRIRLTRADYTFAYVLAMPALSAVAREVVDAYGDRLPAHPVGTGAYVLKSWVPASSITLEANPGFRGIRWDFAAGDDPRDREIVAAMRGKRVPQAQVVEFRVIEEAQAAWLAFRSGKVDISGVPDALAPAAIRGDRLTPELAGQGIRLSRFPAPAIVYTAFNMRDPVVVGGSREHTALRRAIAMAYDNAEEIAVIRKGQAVPLHMPVPAGIAGSSATFRSGIAHDVALANRLLDEVGYRRGQDGYRRQPDGRPLVLRYTTQRDADARAYAELWKKALDSIGVRLAIEQGSYGDQIKAATACRHQIWSYGWSADFPDGDNFMQLLYGPNVHQSNVACYASAAYDALYDRSRQLPDSPERSQLYERMARQAEADTPWVLHGSAWRNVVAQKRVVGYKAHPFLLNDWMYADVLVESAGR